jgi:predicted transcriptional regulator
MHDQRSSAPEQVDSAILGLLLEPGAQRPWSVEEVAREIGDEVATADALARLAGAGLLHRLNSFVWASRAALLAERLVT